MRKLNPGGSVRRVWRTSAVVVRCAVVLVAVVAPGAARASSSQLSIMQDGSELVTAQQTLAQFRMLGVNTVQVTVSWASIAPSPASRRTPRFDAVDPNAYPSRIWAPYDALVRTAQADGLRVDMTVTGGTPRWAEHSPAPAVRLNPTYVAWEPDAAAYGRFTRAVGTRYSGHFIPAGESTPLPAVRFWTLFNEPNFGEDLGPQAIDDSRVLTAPRYYRALVDQGYRALRVTGHGGDTIVIGNFGPAGFEPSRLPRSTGGLPGAFGETVPLLFIRTLYCLGPDYRPLRGAAARRVGCPATAAGSRMFRRRHPGLFQATGVGDHPNTGNAPPNRRSANPDFATLGDLGRLERALDRVNRAYRSHRRDRVYNDEFGYITNPPHRGYLSPATAAADMNWAEYLSWKDPRVASYAQYLLRDPPQVSTPYNGYASGLEFPDGTPKPSFAAYRLPLFLPVTRFARASAVEVWGDARPAPFMRRDGYGSQTAAVQLNGTTVRTIAIRGPGGYFDVRVTVPASGVVRLAYAYPRTDPFLPVGLAGTTVYSRPVTIRLR